MCDKCRKCTLLNSTPNGSLFYNGEHGLVLLEYKNLCFDFYREEYDSFVNYISRLDGEAIEARFADTIHRRKIPVPVGNVCLTILLNVEELTELKLLMGGINRPFLLEEPSKKIDYKMIYN